MELDELLSALDRTAANLGKAEDVWARAKPLIPTRPARGSSPEYEDLARAWKDLLRGLPPIDGWSVTAELPDIVELGQAYLDMELIGEPSFDLARDAERPGYELAEYRFRLSKARRRAARERLGQLTETVDATLPVLLDGVERDSQAVLTHPGVATVVEVVAEVELLLGDTVARRGRWSDLHRHVHFGQGHDWHDIAEMDWPSVKADIQAAGLSDLEPLDVPDIDLGLAAAGTLTGTVSSALPWERIDDDGFERLLYDLMRDISEHQNVQWLTQTRAADRGRDLSLERRLPDSTGGVRTERVIVQAKHWRSRSVRAQDISDTLVGVQLWQPPLIHGLVMATTGRFTTDAVAWAEQHNARGALPLIDLWPDVRLETLLAQRPHLAAAHGLR